jgi:hypothetical protein
MEQTCPARTMPGHNRGLSDGGCPIVNKAKIIASQFLSAVKA